MVRLVNNSDSSESNLEMSASSSGLSESTMEKLESSWDSSESSLVTSENSLGWLENSLERLENSWDWSGSSLERSASSSATWESTGDWSVILRMDWWESSSDWPAGRETWGRTWGSWGSSWGSQPRGRERECRETWPVTPESPAVETRPD